MIAMEAETVGTFQLARLERTDEEALRRFFFRLSPDTLYRRFLSPIARPEQARPERLLDIDHRDREALVALVDGEIVGVARYVRKPGAELADLAVVVADAWQRRGIATLLLRTLAEAAGAIGIRGFSVTMLADNRPVLGLVLSLQPATRLEVSGGVFEGVMPLPWTA